jgi:hypothetical protein
MFKVGAIRGCAVAVLLVSGVCLVSGCSKPMGNVTGKVTYKGKALEFGSVIIAAADGTSLGGDIEPDGTYLIKNVPVGKGKVSVTAQDPKKIEENRKMAQALREGHTIPASGKPGFNSSVNTIPDTYGDTEKSGLTVEVKAGTTQNDIDLK